MKQPIIIISISAIVLASIAGTVILVVEGHPADSIVSLLTVSASLIAATAGILSMQNKNEQHIATVAKNVNGNNTRLLNAAIGLSDEERAKIEADNKKLLPIADREKEK